MQAPLHFIYMAPLKGVTDSLFRKLYSRHFSGIDAAIAPFINPQKKAVPSDKLLSDVLPENNSSLPLIPQVINNTSDDFIALANRLYDLGYQELNWNLGCPVAMVAKKRRGSGLLPFPERIVELLNTIIPRLKVGLSIKMRLGFHDHRESLELLPHLEQFPLTEIIIHARLGKQLYRGKTAPEHFAACRRLTSHTLVYNGDINSVESFQELRNTLPGIDRWMIGRGLVSTPFLPAAIKGNLPPVERRLSILKEFHDDLYQSMKERLSGPGHLLGRMKQIWIYYINSFPHKKKLIKKITKAATEEQYLQIIDKVFI